MMTKFYIPLLFCLAIIVNYLAIGQPELAHAQTMQITFWKYQCIDTMKESRDKARAGLNDPETDANIALEMKTIKSLGANCVAIDTPYDPEFLPYLSKWVAGARKENLHIWFRGNFSGWEGWFGYTKITSTADELAKLNSFIHDNPQLFQNGDIFTGAPEAENGGPFGQINPSQYQDYRQFLIDQNNMEQKAFSSMHKDIITNWFSMNGDVAQKMYDQSTLDQIGKRVTVDHYISNPNDMGDIINYFKNTYGANFVLGEFGAPIPDLNGSMTEEQQAVFVDRVFQQLYQERENVDGINYWDLTDGSTALINPDNSPRKVTEIIKKYFDPQMVVGKVTNEKDEPLPNVTIKTNDSGLTYTTDKNGDYAFPTIATNIKLMIKNGDASASASIAGMKPGKTYEKNFVVTTPKKTFQEKILEFLRSLFH